MTRDKKEKNIANFLIFIVIICQLINGIFDRLNEFISSHFVIVAYKGL